MTLSGTEREAFQIQVNREIEPLYIDERSPVKSMRAKSRAHSSIAWLGPAAMVLIVVALIFGGLPLLRTLMERGLGIVVVVVIPLLLVMVALQLGRRHKNYQQTLRSQQQHIIDQLRELEPEAQEWMLLHERLARKQDLSLDEQADLLESWERVGLQKAEELLARQDVKELLCPALRQAPRDIYGISQTITPVLLENRASGTLVIPRVPLLFASLALLIYRKKAATLCADLWQSDPAAPEQPEAPAS